MKKYNHLLEKVAEKLNIYCGNTETESNYKTRLIYSMLGRMAYASLWDTEEEYDFISLIHFTKRIETLALQLYRTLSRNQVPVFIRKRRFK